MSVLLDSARELLGATGAVPGADRTKLDRLARDLDGPLRVAIVGRMKAGKSTLLNALVGDRVAPTDAAECTRVVTEYRHGMSYKATGVLIGGEHVPLRFERTDSGATIDLGGRTPAVFDRIEVEFPTSLLTDVVLIDTPGISSTDAKVAAAGGKISSRESAAMNVDVVVMVMRQLDPLDIDFLEAFRASGAQALSAVSAVGVLARADEVGGGAPDAMRRAEQMARSWQAVTAVRRSVGRVLPVAGLLAETAAGFSETDFRTLQSIAERLEPIDAKGLRSVDDFVSHGDFAGTEADRRRLVAMFGLHGLVASLRWLRLGMVDSSTSFATQLREHSGLDALSRWVFGTLRSRREVLKVERCLDVIRDIGAAAPSGSTAALERELERFEMSMHELAELRALNRLRADHDLELSAAERDELWLALGGDGPAIDLRSGQSEPLDAIGRWQRTAESSLSSVDMQRFARLAARSITAARVQSLATSKPTHEEQ